MRSTLGMSELHSRKTLPVQACRCSGVPAAKLAVEIAAKASPKMAARGDMKKLEPKRREFLELFFTAKILCLAAPVPRLALAALQFTLPDWIARSVTPVTAARRRRDVLLMLAKARCIGPANRAGTFECALPVR